MIVTLDTNVILAALLSRNGASNRILKLGIQEQLNIAVTTSVLLEYDDALKRAEILKKLNRTVLDIEDILDLITLTANKHSIYYRMRPNLFDDNDDLFVECAFTINSEYLITSNLKDFKRSELISYPFKVVTPGEFYSFWRATYE